MAEYRTESLGRMAVFTIPHSKWCHHNYVQDGKSVSNLTRDFLLANYNGFSVRGPLKGYWREKPRLNTHGIQVGNKLHEEDVMEVKASFLGKDRIPKLKRFLAGMCKLMNETCLYLETGEDSWLVYPK